MAAGKMFKSASKTRGKGKPVPENTKSYVQKELRRNQETKHQDTTVAQAVFAPGTVGVLSNPAQGVGDLQRVGDTISPFELEWRINFRRTGAAGGDLIRVIVFVWKPSTIPVVLNVLNTDTVESPYNHDRHQQYRIISDRLYAMGELTSSINRIQARVKLRRKQLPAKIQFSGASTTASNHVYMIIVGDRASGVDDSDASGTIRFHYKDA